MRHRVAGRKLGRTGEHRLAVMRNLSTALFDKEKIRTTLAKAKELRPFAEKLVTLSKRETLHARRQVLRHIKDRKVVSKLFDSLSARYAQRPGGYTRIIKLGPRRGDHAEMAIIELVGADEALSVEAAEETSATPSRRPRKKKAKVGKKKAESAAAEEAPAKKKGTAKKKAKRAKAAPDKTTKKTATAKKKAKSGARRTKSRSGGK